MADLITGIAPPAALAPLDPGRFQW
jgi:hypothetical protein